MSATSKFSASVLYGPKDVRLDKRTIGLPHADELQIDVKSTGLCGSDLHYYQHGRNGNFHLTSPLALGHEAAGIVTGIGSSLGNVGKWSIGDKIALEVGVPCEQAESCLHCPAGRYNICPNLRFRSSCNGQPHFQGTLQGRLNHPAKWCHKLLPETDLNEAALLEPLGVAIHALRRSNMPARAHCLVFGAGTIGLLVSAMCILSGAQRVLISDIDEGRVAFALENGFATDGYVVTNSAGVDSDHAKLRAAELLATVLKEKVDVLSRGGFDRTFECTGVESCIQASIFATISGGALHPIGMGTPNMCIPLSAATLREVDIIGVFRYANTYPRGIEILESGQIPGLRKLITHVYEGLAKGAEALEMAARTRDDENRLVVKVIVRILEEDVHLASL